MRTSPGGWAVRRALLAGSAVILSLMAVDGACAQSTTTLTYHPTFDAVSQRVEPGLTTDYTYNTIGQLTQVKQTDTTSQSVPYSTSGRTRIWAYTYATGDLLASQQNRARSWACRASLPAGMKPSA